MGQPGLFDYSDRLGALSKLGDPLESLNAVVRWEKFRKSLERSVKRSDRKKGGRPPYDHILMFKILVLQSLYNLSDDQVEYQIKDRLSFMRFLGLTLEKNVPDATTVWLFREELSRNKGAEKLFKQLDNMLCEAGFLACSGQIIDASIIKAPTRRTKKEEKETVKRGEAPENWSSAKKSQTDLDAKWTVKNDIPYFGYKNHINIDKKHRFIRSFEVTDASVHDSRAFEAVYDPENYGSPVWADSAYRAERIEQFLEAKGKTSKIHWKKPKNKPLSGHKKRSNRAGSKIRSVVEHVFGRQKSQMALCIRTIGLKRAKTKIGLANLVYNLTRLEFLERISLSTA